MSDPVLPPDEESYVEPRFDLRRGLKVLVIVGTIVIIISVICIALDSRY
jgi:hypothetical protein